MNGISTITTRGQVVIPQLIREYFGLKSSDKLFFEVKDNKIIAQPIVSLNDAMGMIKTKIKLSKKEAKQTVKNYLIKKYKKT